MPSCRLNFFYFFLRLGVDIFLQGVYITYMNTKKELQEIIQQNTEAAELGCAFSRMKIINAQAELDKIESQSKESVLELFSQQQRNLVEFSLTF